MVWSDSPWTRTRARRWAVAGSTLRRPGGPWREGSGWAGGARLLGGRPRPRRAGNDARVVGSRGSRVGASGQSLPSPPRNARPRPGQGLALQRSPEDPGPDLGAARRGGRPRVPGSGDTCPATRSRGGEPWGLLGSQADKVPARRSPIVSHRSQVQQGGGCIVEEPCVPGRQDPVRRLA